VEPKIILPHCPTVNLRGSLVVVGVALQHNRLGAKCQFLLRGNPETWILSTLCRGRERGKHRSFVFKSSFTKDLEYVPSVALPSWPTSFKKKRIGFLQRDEIGSFMSRSNSLG
jgi:hypothetical protein